MKYTVIILYVLSVLLTASEVDAERSLRRSPRRLQMEAKQQKEKKPPKGNNKAAKNKNKKKKKAAKKENKSEPRCKAQDSQPGFNIQLCNMSDETRWDAAFRKAAEKWEAVIVEGLPDVPKSTRRHFDLFQGLYGPDEMTNFAVDDIVIAYSFQNIGGVGFGGYMRERDEGFGGGLPYIGRIVLNSELFIEGDLAEEAVIDYMTREIGHALGIGTLWNNADTTCKGDCSRRTSTTGVYGCSSAATEYENLNVIGGSDDLLLDGEACSRWDESSFPAQTLKWSDVMTATFRAGDKQLLTRVTAGAMEDLGYKVDYSKADPVPTV